MKALAIYLFSFSVALFSQVIFAYDNLPGAGAAMPEVVHLRKDCAANNPNLTNCADTMFDMLNWVWGIRNPSVTSPLIIDVGPGEFDSFICYGSSDANRKGWVTLRGSGQRITNLAAKDGGTITQINPGITAVEVDKCTNLTFQDLTVAAHNYGVAWTGNGTSTWSNIEIASAIDANQQNIGWYENSCSVGARGVHYWFGSRITAHQDGTGRANYFSCAETWFYGGEIAVIVSGDKYGSAVPVRLHTGGSMRVFGSAVRVVVPPGNTAPLSHATGVVVRGGSDFHMHGGIISINASGSSQPFDVTGIQVNDGFAHTPDTAFSLIASGGGSNVKRIKLAGPAASSPDTSIQSPFLWPASSTPPSGSSDKAGADQFVENDCSVAGNCDNGGTETHLMISNPAKCGASDPWFDTQTGQCRAVNTP